MTGAAMDRVLAVLDVGTNEMARCPAHADGRPSLHVTQGDKGVTLKCFAGCKTEAIVGKLGFTLADLFDAPRSQTGTGDGKPREVATYPYTDENGTLLYEVVRREPKAFVQRRPNGHGGWDYKLGDVRRVLYRLPQVATAIANGVPIWIVEGEKDVAALERGSEVATTCAMGAGKWRAEYTESLRGAHVIVLADDDEPGRKHALHVASELRPVVASLDLRLPAAGHKDVADHLGAGLTLGDLRSFNSTPEREKDATDWPTIDPAAFHGPLGAFVLDAAPHTEADPVAILVQGLAAVGAVIGRGPFVLVGNDRHPACLFVVPVGKSAKGGKGTSWRIVESLVERIDPTFAKTRMLSGYGSGEKLVDDLASPEEGPHDERLFGYYGEFTSFLTVAGREGSLLSTVVRDGWDGRTLRARARNKTVTADRYHLALVGHITENELRVTLPQVATFNGFANRIGWAMVRRVRSLPEGGNVPDDVFDNAAKIIGERITNVSRRWHLDDDAKLLWRRLYAEFDADEPGGALEAVIARAAPMTLRIALIYSVLDGDTEIRVAHLEAANAVWCYFRQSAHHLFGQSSGNTGADKLRRAIEDSGRGGLNLTKQSSVFGNNKSRDELAAYRSLLERSDQIFTVTVPSGEPGRDETLSIATKYRAEWDRRTKETN